MSKNLLFLILIIYNLGCKSQSTEPTPPPPVALNLKTANPAIKFGSHININQNHPDNEAYKAIIQKEFGACQSLWYPGFNIGWLSKTNYNFTNFNDNVNYMVANKITPIMHMLFGPNQYEPDWLVNGNFTAAELEVLMKDMIDKIMESNDNKNKVEIWNVINELYNNGDGTYQKDILWTKMGYEDDKSGLTGEDNINTKHPIFIRKAFEYCRAKTNKKLEIRDYNIESNDPNNGNNRKHKAIYQLIKHMKNSNIPIDALGIQGHFDIGAISSMVSNFEIEAGFSRFKKLGIEVYVTEMDFGTKDTYTEVKKTQQGSDYFNYVKQAVLGGATIINTWGIYDNSDLYWRQNENPLLWDTKLVKKPIYNKVIDALKATKK